MALSANCWIIVSSCSPGPADVSRLGWPIYTPLGPRPIELCSDCAADQVGGFLAHHDAGRIGVAGRHGREDGGIGHAQPVEAVHLEALIDHGTGTRRSHAAGADRVIGSLRVGADPAEDL